MTSFVLSPSFYTTFEPLYHMAGYPDLDTYVSQLKKGMEVRAAVSTCSYNQGEVFTLASDPYFAFNKNNSCWLVKVVGRRSFAAQHLTPLNSGENMQSIPKNKFFAVAQENANSKRTYFVAADNTPEAVEKAYEEARGYAVDMIRKGSNGVVILESKTVLRPKTEFEESSY